jgi:sulfate transport system ATP-binding protein
MSEGKIEQIGTPDEIYDMPSSPFVFSFIGEANKLSVNINNGQIWLDEHFLDLVVSDMPSGPAQLFFRPHDVEVKKHLAGAIPAKVQGMRRHGGVRRLDLEVVDRSDRIESTCRQILASTVPSRSEFVRGVISFIGRLAKQVFPAELKHSGVRN